MILWRPTITLRPTWLTSMPRIALRPPWRRRAGRGRAAWTKESRTWAFSRPRTLTVSCTSTFVCRPLHLKQFSNVHVFLFFCRLWWWFLCEARSSCSLSEEPPAHQRHPQWDRGAWRPLGRHCRPHAGPQKAGPVSHGTPGRKILQSTDKQIFWCQHIVTLESCGSICVRKKLEVLRFNVWHSN